MGDFDPAIEAFPVTRNRHGLKVFVKVITPPEVRGSAYLAHGFSDVHDAAHMRAMTAAFVRAGFRVIVWDATHSWGRSEGERERATFYYHHEDLEDVIEWSRSQDWYEPEFLVAGHSLGGLMAGAYAAAHPKQVAGLVLVSPVVSGPALRRRIPLPVRAWWRLRGRVTPPMRGAKAIAWEFLRSSWSYNLLAEGRRLVMPVLIVGAGRDYIVPPRLLRRLLRAIGHESKRLEIVPGVRHGFDGAWEMERLEAVVSEWLRVDTNK